MDDKSAFDGEPMDTSSKDVTVSVESTNEWQIHDILYDGTERYLKPLTFQDYVAKLAHKVDWRKLIDGESSQFDPTAVDEEALESEEEEKPKSSTEPESVGPWETVAKNLHLALTEMNVLLDVVKIAQDRKYLVLDPVDSSGEPDSANKMSLAQLFTFKKKVMSQGQKVFENIADRLQRAKQSVAQTKEPDFQTELIELRQAWRLKKIGNTVLGDLCYKNSATKFRPNSTFEVKKSETVVGGGVRTSAIEISLPKDLEQAMCLKITIENSSTSDDVSQPIAEVYFHGDKPSFRAGLKLWQQKLIVAQRTLLCRDLYAQLSKEAIHLKDVSCLVRGDCMTINFCHGYILKIKLEPVGGFAAENQDVPPTQTNCRRVFVLEHNLFQLFCADLDGVAAPIASRPVSAPLTSQNKSQRVAGPEALSGAVLSAETDADKLLLTRLIEQAKHYTLVTSVRNALNKFVDDCCDPAVSLHWLSETTGVWSAVRISMMTPFYESYNKTLIMLEIGVNSLTATTKEGEEIKFTTNVDEFINYLKITAKQHLIYALANMSRQSNWFMLYHSLSSVDERGDITPAILITNQSGNKSVCVKCPLYDDPQILVQCEAKSSDEFRSDLLTNDLWTFVRGSYRLVDYKNLIGRCFLHKLELLLACLS